MPTQEESLRAKLEKRNKTRKRKKPGPKPKIEPDIGPTMMEELQPLIDRANVYGQLLTLRKHDD